MSRRSTAPVATKAVITSSTTNGVLRLPRPRMAAATAPPTPTIVSAPSRIWNTIGRTGGGMVHPTVDQNIAVARAMRLASRSRPASTRPGWCTTASRASKAPLTPFCTDGGSTRGARMLARSAEPLMSSLRTVVPPHRTDDDPGTGWGGPVNRPMASTASSA